MKKGLDESHHHDHNNDDPIIDKNNNNLTLKVWKSKFKCDDYGPISMAKNKQSF